MTLPASVDLSDAAYRVAYGPDSLWAATHPSGPFVLAIDIGGTKVAAALVTFDGIVVESTRHRAQTSGDRDADEVFEAVREAASGALYGVSHNDIAGIGIGSAGPGDLRHGMVGPVNIAAWRRGFPLRKRIEEAFPGLPVVLGNDGVCMALAEHWQGAGQGIDYLLAMVVSTGIGGGLIIGGHPYFGRTGNAGHIGHVQIAGGTERCNCGGIGCAETVGSGPAAVRWAKAHGWHGGRESQVLGGRELAVDARAGDPVARRAWDRAGYAVGCAVANASAMVDLDRVTIGGGFGSQFDLLYPGIKRAIDERVGMTFFDRLEVVPTGLGEDGPLLGAAALVIRPDNGGPTR